MCQFLPNSCLLGVQLTISTHSGPQVIYHYPPSSAEYVSERQHQQNHKSAPFDDKIGRKHLNENDERKASIVATLTGQSLRSSEYRLVGEANGTSPNIDSSMSSSIQYRGITNPNHQDETQSGQEQSSDSESSGLSDSELSTDYADCSSSSSSSSSSNSFIDPNASSNHLQVESSSDNTAANFELSLSNIMDNNTNSPISQPSRLLRPKTSQISATKLLDVFNKETKSRRESRASKLSTGMNYIEDYDLETLTDDDTELLGMLERNEICMDDNYFDENVFLDTKKIFGFDVELVAEFCSPERSMCNTRFEFTMDQFCFLGLPIHVDAEGNWRTSKKKRRSSNRSKRSNSTGTKSSRTRYQPSRSEDKNVKTDLQNASHDNEEKNDNDPSALEENGPHFENDGSSPKDDIEKSMDMFHVCFIMNPPLVEYNERVDDMFHYVVARLSLLLRYAEAKSKFVSTQCHIISKERELVIKSSKKYKSIAGSAKKAKYLYQRILAKSSLARALTTCVDKIQNDEMACLEIGEDKVISLQIPIQSEFRILPNLKLDPVLRGSYLTSILNSKFLEASSTRDIQNNLFTGEDDTDDTDDLLNYALILLEEPANIINDLETLSSEDDLGNVILTHLIKHIQPSMPLKSYQSIIDRLLGESSESSGLGIQSSFQTSMLRSCALHLMYQRHARVIIPVSSKNTYIVSPLAPINGHSKNDFTSAGDTSIFTDKPLIYQNQEIFSKKFPSLPSLPSFLNLLSSKKPKAFGSIIPSKEHKQVYLKALIWLIRYGYVTQLLTFVCLRVDKQIKMAVEEDMEKETPTVKHAYSKRDNDLVDNVLKDQDNSVPTTQKNNILPKMNPFQYQTEDEEEATFGYDDLYMEKDYTIILEPERATAIEKRWIKKCIQDQPPDVRLIFNKIFKYFNGRTPMESVMIRENVSRHELKKVIISLDKYLIEFHHW